MIKSSWPTHDFRIEGEAIKRKLRANQLLWLFLFFREVFASSNFISRAGQRCSPRSITHFARWNIYFEQITCCSVGGERSHESCKSPLNYFFTLRNDFAGADWRVQHWNCSASRFSFSDKTRATFASSRAALKRFVSIWEIDGCPTAIECRIPRPLQALKTFSLSRQKNRPEWVSDGSENLKVRRWAGKLMRKDAGEIRGEIRGTAITTTRVRVQWLSTWYAQPLRNQ